MGLSMQQNQKHAKERASNQSASQPTNKGPEDVTGIIGKYGARTFGCPNARGFLWKLSAIWSRNLKNFTSLVLGRKRL